MEPQAEKTSVKTPEYGSQPLFGKLPRNTVGEKVAVETNLRKLTIARNTPIFKYAVTINFVYKGADGKEVVKEISKSVKHGTEHEADKTRCQRVYLRALTKFPKSKDPVPLFYDRQASLYSLIEIKDESKLCFSITDNVSKKDNFVRAEFKLAKVADSFQSTSEDLKKSFNACPKLVDKTLFEALNIMISAPAFANSNVVTLGNCVHYLYDHSATGIREISFPQGLRYGAVGTVKSVKTLQGAPDGDKSVSLYITNELKMSLFHPDNTSLNELLATFSGFDARLKANSNAASVMRKALVGAEAWLDYGKGDAVFEEAIVVSIRGFGLSARDQMFDLEGKMVSVAQYFKTKYNKTLRHPDLFTIEVKGRRGKMFIPAECLRLCPNQAVHTDQMIGTEQPEMIKLAAAKPHERKRATDEAVAAVGITAKVGFVEVSTPVKVEGIVLPKPAIVFGGGRKVQFNDPNKRGPATDFVAAGHYVIPAKLTNWEMMFVKNEGLPEVARALCDEMSKSGMTVKPPVISFYEERDLDRVFADAKRASRQLLFFVTKKHRALHGKIKSLEQQHDLLTQEVVFENVQKMGMQTRKNIVNKINIKLGGLNYFLDTKALSNPKRLFVGFETSSRGGAGPDGIISVGYAANMMANHQQFNGGYIYVKKDADVYGSIIEDTLITILETTTAKRGEPGEIFVFFSGMTEGQYGLVNEAYTDAVKKACGARRSSYRPHITVVTASKTHNERLYKSGGQGVQNLEPGTVVDHTIVSPVWNEFYLASAVARQGTIKAAKYTIIFSTNKMSTMKDFEEMVMDLCYEHQIVLHPVSLPAPLYLAGRYSERGSANLATEGPVIIDGVVDIEATNARLGYSGKRLQGTRFNA